MSCAEFSVIFYLFLYCSTRSPTGWERRTKLGMEEGLFGHDKGKITRREFSAESENIDKMLWQFIFPWLFIFHQPLLRNSLPGCVVHALHHFSSDAQPAAKRSHVSLYCISAVKVQKCLLQSSHYVVWAGLSDTVGTVNIGRVYVCVCVLECVVSNLSATVCW